LTVRALVDVLHQFDEALRVGFIREKANPDAAGRFVEGNRLAQKRTELGLAIVADSNAEVNEDGGPPQPG
jgi:hypothetical protein